jgi:hypothetical protein
MPVTRIAIRDGKTSQYKQALLDEIYEATRETVAIKEGDRFMAITEHRIRVRPRSVSRDIETAAENWPFGNGETQFYAPA